MDLWNSNEVVDDIIPRAADLSLGNEDSFYKGSDLNIKDANDDIINDELDLHRASAKLLSSNNKNIDLTADDQLYKSAVIGSSNVLEDEIFNYGSLEPHTYVKFSYKDIPALLDLIFEGINKENSSNSKNSLLPAILVFQMLRYSSMKKLNSLLTTNFFDLFINRVYLVIENDKNKDIVVMSYWISVVNYLYYFLLRQDDFFKHNPNFLKKIAALLNDLFNEFLNGITIRLEKLLDDCVINYSSIPNLTKGLLFQNDWNFFKKQANSGNNFQEILDNLYPPDLKDQGKASPIKFLQILEAIIYMFRVYNINTVLLKNLLSRVLHWINSIVFNRIIDNRKLLSRTRAIQIRLNLSVIEDWIRSISKNLEVEEIELNGSNNQEYIEEDLMDLIHDYPDDIIDYKYELANVLRFRANSRFQVEEPKEYKENDTEDKEEALKNVVATPMANLADEEEDDNDEDNYKSYKVDIKSTPVHCFSDFYYSSLNSIFEYDFRVLYNLLQFLQVSTTYITSISENLEENFINFLNQDMIFLNFKQIHHICKNYRYEVDELKFSKKLLKYLDKNTSTSDKLKFITYNYSSNKSEELLYLNPSSADFPISLPTKQELINKFGAGYRGLNRENLLKYQPFLQPQIRDSIDNIHDMQDYTAAGDEDDGDYDLEAPVSVAAKTWEMNDHSTKAESKPISENENVEYNPW